MKISLYVPCILGAIQGLFLLAGGLLIFLAE